MAAIFLIWLAISGLLLNHTSYFGLASKVLPLELARSVYPVGTTTVYQFKAPFGLLTQKASALFLDGVLIQPCEGNLIAVVSLGVESWVSCSERILVLGRDGTLIETMDKHTGLPTPIERMGRCGPQVCILNEGRTVQFSQGSWRDYPDQVMWNTALQAKANTVALVPEVHNWQRFILEAHSGRLFGRFGVLVVDLAALATLLLALSGCYVWWSHNRRRRLAKRRSDAGKS